MREAPGIRQDDRISQKVRRTLIRVDHYFVILLRESSFDQLKFIHLFRHRVETDDRDQVIFSLFFILFPGHDPIFEKSTFTGTDSGKPGDLLYVPVIQADRRKDPEIEKCLVTDILFPGRIKCRHSAFQSGEKADAERDDHQDRQIPHQAPFNASENDLPVTALHVRITIRDLLWIPDPD